MRQRGSHILASEAYDQSSNYNAPVSFHGACRNAPSSFREMNATLGGCNRGSKLFQYGHSL